MYWMPQLFDYGMMGAWQASQPQDMEESARAAMRQAIARYDFALPGDIRRRIDAVYEKHCARFGLELQEILPD